MPRSMTGYGSAEAAGAEGRMRADLRGINGRFLEVRVRVPSSLAPYEADFRRKVSEQFQRGRLDLAVSWEPAEGTYAPVKVNAALAKALVAAAQNLRDETGLTGELRVAEVLALPGVVEPVRSESADVSMRDLAMSAVESAARDVAAMRVAEGRATAADISGRLDRLRTLRASVAAKADTVPAAAKQKLQDRLARLGVEGAADPARLAQEVAYLADKSDIAEELSRLDAHLTRCRETMARDDQPCGKTLEFLAQELHREVNTIGSKSSDIDISGWVLEMKTEIERIREQVLNLE